MFELSGGSNFADFLWKLFLAIIVAVPIGLDREKTRKFAGLRTSLLVATLGFFSSFLSRLLSAPVIIFISVAFAVGISILIYYFRGRHERHPGLTTSAVFVLLFFLGVLVEAGLALEAISASIIITTLLALKPFAKLVVKNLSERELLEAMVFSALSFIFLPLLPNRPVDPWGIFNPFVFLSMTLLVLGLGFAGYFVAKIFGEKAAAGVAGISGGLSSLVAANMALSERAREFPRFVRAGKIALILASAITVVRIFLLVFVLDRGVANYLAIPLLVVFSIPIALSGHEVVSAFGKEGRGFSLGMKQVPHLAFGTAFRFGILFTFLIVFFKLVYPVAGVGGTYLTAAVAGFASLNALIVSIVALSSAGAISSKEAAVSIIIGLASNLSANLAISYKLGGRELGNSLAKSFGLSAIASAVLAAVLHFFWGV